MLVNFYGARNKRLKDVSNEKVIILIIALAVIITGFWIIFLQFEPTKKEAKEPTVTANKTTTKEQNSVSEIAIPTLFVHGYSGTANSFGGMINRPLLKTGM